MLLKNTRKSSSVFSGSLFQFRYSTFNNCIGSLENTYINTVLLEGIGEVGVERTEGATQPQFEGHIVK